MEICCIHSSHARLHRPAALPARFVQQHTANKRDQVRPGGGRAQCCHCHFWLQLFSLCLAAITGQPASSGLGCDVLPSSPVHTTISYAIPGCCSCEALPKGKKGLPQRWAVALQHSPFYPEGGGQPADGGTLQPQGDARQVLSSCHLHSLLPWVIRQAAIELMALA